MPANTEQELIRELLRYVGLNRNQAESVLLQYPELTVGALQSLTEIDYLNIRGVGINAARKLIEGFSELTQRRVISYEVDFITNRESWLFHKVQQEFIRFLESKRGQILELTLNRLMVNPYMIFLLKDTNGLDNVNDLIDFLMGQHIERSIVTSFGTTIETIAGIFCEESQGRRARHIDLKKQNGNILYGISVKSGPNTINSPDVNDISEALDAWKAEVPPGIEQIYSVLGLTYGREPSTFCRQVEANGHVLYFGRHFWDFVSRGVVSEPETTYAKVKDAAELAVAAFGYNAIRDAVGLAGIKIKSAFVERYCNDNGKILWENILEDNM